MSNWNDHEAERCLVLVGSCWADFWGVLSDSVAMESDKNMKGE